MHLLWSSSTNWIKKVYLSTSLSLAVYNKDMIYLGADHGGFKLKEELKQFLAERQVETKDLGAFSLDPADDYTEFVIPVARKVTAELGSLGIVIGRSGNGEAIAANKIKGIRAAVCLNPAMAEKTRDHNDANILSLGADYITEEQAREIVQKFIDTPFSNAERHLRRLKKIAELENS